MELGSVSDDAVQSTVATRSDGVKVSSTLLLEQHFEKTTTTLQQALLKNPSVNLFLRLMGIVLYVPESPSWINALQLIWSGLIRAGLAMMIVSGCTMIYHSLDNYYGSICADEAYTFFGVTLLLQVLVLAVGLFLIVRKMDSTCTGNDIMIMNSSLNFSYVILFISLVIGLVPAFVGHSSALFVIGEMSICCVLTAVMFFITTDCKVANMLLDQLIQQQHLQCLTFDQYILVRNEVKQRQKSSSWFNNGIVLVALLDVLCVLVSVFIGMNPADPRTIFIWSLFLKELPFLCVVYWQVAHVNEKSREFIQHLAEKRWNTEDGRNQERKDIYICALGTPIEMSLAGMTLTRKDLVLQLVAWGVAFLLSVLRSAAANDVKL